MTTIQLKEHLMGLRGISTVASKLFNLLGEQITSASHTIPIQRGIEIVHHFIPPLLNVSPTVLGLS